MASAGIVNFDFIPGSIVQSWMNQQFVSQIRTNFQFISNLDNELDMTMSALNDGMEQMQDAYEVLQVLALAVLVVAAVSVILFITSLIILGRAKHVITVGGGGAVETKPPKPKKPKRRLKLSFVTVEQPQESQPTQTVSKPLNVSTTVPPSSKKSTEQELEEALNQLREQSKKAFKYQPPTQVV